MSIEMQSEQKTTDNDVKEALRTEYEKGRADAIAEFQQEWSEEDEEMYKEVLTDIIYAKNDLEAKRCCGSSKRAMKAFNWFSKRFKSLSSQSTWKPSDDQLEALEHSLGDYNITIFEERHETLTSLYQDLQKLREE